VRALAAVFFALFILCGALGLRTVEDCNSDPKVVTVGEQMQCFREVAMTQAYICPPLSPSQPQSCTRAIDTCISIWNNFGSTIASDAPNKDVRKKAELISNACLMDVAKITRDPAVCENIVDHDNFGAKTGLLGTGITKDACLDEAGRLFNLAPENYYQVGKDNICSIVFVFPFLFLGANRSRGP